MWARDTLYRSTLINLDLLHYGMKQYNANPLFSTYDHKEIDDALLFRNIVREDRYAFDDETDLTCAPITDAEGRKPKTRWIANVRVQTENGGPVFWVHENYRCPNCATRWSEYRDSQWKDGLYDECCDEAPEGYFCRPDSVDLDEDDDVSF